MYLLLLSKPRTDKEEERSSKGGGGELVVPKWQAKRTRNVKAGKLGSPTAAWPASTSSFPKLIQNRRSARLAKPSPDSSSTMICLESFLAAFVLGKLSQPSLTNTKA
jgi:hypothetical protein